MSRHRRRSDLPLDGVRVRHPNRSAGGRTKPWHRRQRIEDA